ncbi:zf-HC2 domain-containing protein [Lysinibacillus sp. CNPSo 3705]|uniref:zf-HC2 domain-containing protein n=1 Tax=Lysinibacillus sp. CNPSo 3705 TaxID=3028148 RepID=UPI00236320B8|nr:zf-HC2 domain-containing protein [Lysinibacillus sp. CNPSo 3705]MDD1502791.1 zf-HC2 domain-containing protein [Lysinibacillus sp. CNPSo 3705]
MNHDIFKDLVPSYIEKLTSEETTRQMKKHMSECEECKKYVMEMQEGFLVENTREINKGKESIDYLKKVRFKNRRKIFVVAGSLLAFFLIISVSYYFLFVHMWIADENNVQKNIQRHGTTVTLTFQTKSNNRYLLAMEDSRNNKYKDEIIIYESWNILADKKWNFFSELAKSHRDGVNITYTFLDENTLLLNNGEEKELSDEDKIKIQFKNNTEEIRLKDLYNLNH